MQRKEILKIFRKKNIKGEEFLIVKSSNNKTIRKFILDGRVKKIKNFKEQERASEEAVLNYFKDKHKGAYIPTTEKNLNKYISMSIQRNKDKEYFARKREFANKNRIIFSNEQRIKNYTYTYIRVTVKIFFDGHLVIKHGRSVYMQRRIKKEELRFFIEQAIYNAIGPFGSNVKFSLVKWEYGFYQKRDIDFDKI